MTFDQLILEASSRGASDIHLRADHVPLVRIDGALERWTHVAPISGAALEARGHPRAVAAASGPAADEDGSGRRVAGRRRRPHPRQRVPPARHHRGVDASDSRAGSDARVARPAAVGHRPGRRVARPDSRHRRDRQRQEHDARVAGRTASTRCARCTSSRLKTRSNSCTTTRRPS